MLPDAVELAYFACLALVRLWVIWGESSVLPGARPLFTREFPAEKFDDLGGNCRLREFGMPRSIRRIPKAAWRNW